MFSFKQSDLDELRNSCNYLSDVIIEFYFTYLSSIHPSDSILFVPPAISYLLANFQDKKDIADCVKPLELPSKDLIFFPVNSQGVHWSLLVYSRELNVFAHHDSLSGLNNSEAKELFKAVKDCVHHETESFGYRLGFRNKRRQLDGPSRGARFCAKLPSPRQKNGYDCGLYVMAMAKAICQWFSSGVREPTWFREIDKVDDRVEITMRHHVLELIRDASQGRLGSVSCTIEEERRVSVPSSSGNFEGLTVDKIELQQFWAIYDEPTDSKATATPSMETAVGKVIANDSQSLMEEESNNEKIQLITKEGVNDSAMESCDSIIVEGVTSGLGREDIKYVSVTPSTKSDCRTSAPDREYLTQWPPRSSTVAQWPPEDRSSTVEIQRGTHSLFWQNLQKR